MISIRPIKTKKDHKAALKEIERLFDAKPNTPDGDKLEVLVTLTQVYEDTHYPIDLPDAVEALRYWMESRGLSRKDLEPYIGTRARIAEILNYKRDLTLNMIINLHNELHIPAELLIKKRIVNRRHIHGK